jgi:hypothetical protein
MNTTAKPTDPTAQRDGWALECPHCGHLWKATRGDMRASPGTWLICPGCVDKQDPRGEEGIPHDCRKNCDLTATQTG